jgi:hypothetical protein
MLFTIPVLAVTADNLGERGARRVAYQDFMSWIEANRSAVLSAGKEVENRDRAALNKGNSN